MYLPDKTIETQPEIKPADPVADALLRAAKLIRDRGWCQGQYEAPSGAVCVSEAIGLAETGRHMSFCGPAYVYFAAFVGIPGESPTGWNDHTAKSASHVIATLESAALSRALSIAGERE